MFFKQVASVIDRVMQLDQNEISRKLQADYKYVTAHSTMEWAESFLADLERASEPINRVTKLVSILVIFGSNLMTFVRGLVLALVSACWNLRAFVIFRRIWCFISFRNPRDVCFFWITMER